jgi:hypothetical protein
MTIRTEIKKQLKDEIFVWQLECTDLVEPLGTTRGSPAEQHCITGCIPNNNTEISDVSECFVCWAFLVNTFGGSTGYVHPSVPSPKLLDRYR